MRRKDHLVAQILSRMLFLYKKCKNNGTEYCLINELTKNINDSKIYIG